MSRLLLRGFGPLIPYTRGKFRVGVSIRCRIIAFRFSHIAMGSHGSGRVRYGHALVQRGSGRAHGQGRGSFLLSRFRFPAFLSYFMYNRKGDAFPNDTSQQCLDIKLVSLRLPRIQESYVALSFGWLIRSSLWALLQPSSPHMNPYRLIKL